MKMNTIEYWAMNNPVRSAVQRFYEAPRLKRVSNSKGGEVLEIGCGSGVGARIIDRMFSPSGYTGVDLDPRMIRRAEKKSGGLANTRFMVGDASTLPFDDAAYDLVVDFGVVHHIPNWREALAEIHRVLKPGGEFLFEDLSRETWKWGIGRPLKPILDHPYEEMFSQSEFLDALRDLGFEFEVYRNRPMTFVYFWGRATKLPAA